MTSKERATDSMRKASFDKSHDEFENWLFWYRDFLAKIQEAKQVVSRKFEKLELLEAIILRCAVRWEDLVLNDMIISLNRDSSKYSNELGLRLRKHLTLSEAEVILVGHRYIDFRSVSEIKAFGKRYLLSRFNPFKVITNPWSDAIDEFLTMRNLLAHYSRKAWRTYRTMMRNRYRLKRIPEPGSFLFSTNPSTHYVRWSEYLGTFHKCSRAMRRAVSGA